VSKPVLSRRTFVTKERSQAVNTQNYRNHTSSNKVETRFAIFLIPIGPIMKQLVNEWTMIITLKIDTITICEMAENEMADNEIQ